MHRSGADHPDDFRPVARIVSNEHALLFQDRRDPARIKASADLFLPRRGGDEDVPAVGRCTIRAQDFVILIKSGIGP